MGAGPPEPVVRPEPRRRDLDAQEPLRRCAAELVGTFLLTFVAAGAEVMSALHPRDVGAGAKAVAPGLVILAMVYAVSDVSGAHFNPAVTLGFAVRGDFRWAFVPAYWASQAAGAIAAAGLLRWMFGDVAHLGATTPTVSSSVAVGLEVVLTATLVTVILGTATRAGVLGPHAAIPVGATIALAGLVFGPVTGASMNPARSLGPALVGSTVTHLWIYAVGPAAGALVAVAVTWLVHGGRDSEERQAAEGDASPS